MVFKFDDKKFLLEYNKEKQSFMKHFSKDTITFFQTFENFMIDIIKAEERAFIRRLLIFEFIIPIHHIYKKSNSLANFCKEELPYFFIIA